MTATVDNAVVDLQRIISEIQRRLEERTAGITARDRDGRSYLSSQTSSRRQPLNRLLTISVSPLT